jgi:CRP/FNR family transcriptional regulator, anaerobic regulatory protein
MSNSLIAFLKLFRDISEHDIQLITDAWEYRVYKEGEVLFKEGNIAQEIFFITEGVLKISAFSKKGKEVIYFFLKENQFCTVLNSFNNGIVANETILAACPVEVRVVTKEKLVVLYRRVPWLKTLIDQIAQQRLLDRIQIRNVYMGENSSARYKLFLMQQPDIALRVRPGDIASYLGITPQSLSRIRKSI